MATKDARIDAYIARSAPFARPILRHLRQLVHDGCPEVRETLKWGHPSFEYKGILCGMAAFKEHATFGFWKGKLIVDRNGADLDAAMGQFGRITSLDDLPAKRVIVRYVRKAVVLNDAGVTVKRVVKPRAPLPVPRELAAALARNRKARETFEGFSPSNRRDYLEWISEAKQDATRARRIATTIEWLAAGKKRNWKYEKC